MTSSEAAVGWPVVVWLITAAVLHFPLGQYLALRVAVTQPLSHALLFAALVVGNVGVIVVLERLGMKRAILTYGSVLFWVVFWSGSRFIQAFDIWWGIAVALTVLVGAIALTARLVELRALRMLFFAAGVYLTLAPWAAHLDSFGEATPRIDVAGSPVPEASLGKRPDVYVLVLDGFSGLQRLKALDGWTDHGVEKLRAEGFLVTPAWSAYASTAYSVAGLLDGSYPVLPVRGAAPELQVETSIITTGGASALGYFDHLGYQMTFMEPPWVGYRCPPQTDDCVTAPLLDELLYYVLDRSFIGPILDRTVGSAWTSAALRTFSQFERAAIRASTNDVPDLVYAHVIVPHEPFLLDENCRVSYRAEFDVVTIQAQEDSSGERAYVRQVRCVESKLLEIATHIPVDAITVFTSDHGAALEGQSTRAPSAWTDADLLERMSAFVAVRAPEPCLPQDPVIVQALLHGVMRCLGAEGLKPLEPRIFVNSLYAVDGYRQMVEVPFDRVADLVGDR